MPIKLEQDIHQGVMTQTLNDVGAWITRTHNNLLAAGLVQTADTGQVASVSGETATVAANTLHGYRVYEVNDAYSSNTPVYIRLEFRTVSATSSATYRFGLLNVTVGFATDGAGLIGNSQVSKSLKVFTANNGSAITLNPNTRTMTIKGDDFLFHGNELCAGFQASVNVYESGFFAIIRNKINGNVNPERITFIYPIAAASSTTSGVLRYTQLVKNGGVSSENSHLFRLPRIRNEQSLLVASEADISENGSLVGTDRLICFRATSDDTPWVTHNLSVDGLTAKTYLHLPMSPSTNTSYTPASVEKLYLTALVDLAETTVGAMGVLISE